MALHSAVKGKLISVIGDEVYNIFDNLMKKKFEYIYFVIGHLCWIFAWWSRGDQQKSSSQFYGS